MEGRERASASFGLWLAVLALAGFAARVTFVLALRPGLDTRFDPTVYHLLGLNLADGLGYVRPPQMLQGPAVPTAEFGPVLPFLLAAATKLGLRTPTAHALVTTVIGAGTIAVVGLLGRRVAGARVGLVAAAIVAFHPLLVQVDGALVTESPYLLLVAGLLLATIRACDEPTVWRWVVVGLLAGVAALTRAEALALLAMLVIPAAAIRARPGWRRVLAGVAVPVAAAALVVLPWTIRNQTTFHRFVPVSNNVGSVMLGAHCAPTYAAGPRQGGWDFGCIAAFAASDPANRISDVAPGAALPNEAEVYARWRDEGIRYAVDHPGGFLTSFPARLARTWGVYWDPDDQLNYDLREGRDRTLQIVGYVVAIVLLVLAAFGVRPLWRRLGPRRWVVLVLAAPVAVTVVLAFLTYGSTRFRTIAEPTIAIFAAMTLVSLAERRRPAQDRGVRTPSSTS